MTLLRFLADWRSSRAHRAAMAVARAAAARGDWAAALRACEAALASRPTDADAWWLKGGLLLRMNAAQAAARAYALHAEILEAPVATRVLRLAMLDPARAAQGLPYYCQLTDVLVDTAHWTVIAGDRMYAADVHGRNPANNPFVAGRITPDGETVVFSAPAPTSTIDAPVVLVGGDENYSHWLFRNLLKLCALDAAGLLYQRPWLVNEDLAPWQHDMLGLLGIDPAQRITVKRNEVIRCRDVLVPALLTSSSAIAQGVAWLRERCAAHCVPEAQARDLLFVSRADATRRRVLNEDALRQRLEARGFRTVVAAGMDVYAQMRVFSSARLVVAIHGAALTNMIFSPAHARFVELCGSRWASMSEFRRLAKARGQRIDTLICDRYPADASPNDPHADHYVDVDAVMASVERLLADDY